MTRVEIPLEGPEDQGHLLPADEWAQVVSDAHTHARLAAQTTTRAVALTILNLPAKFHGGAQTPTVQVVHDAETPITDGYAKSIGQFFQRGPAAGTSAHRMIGPNTVVRMLALDVVGYHCGPIGNRATVGYEQCGYASYTRAQWTTADGLAQLETLAAELARDAQAWGIPDRHLTDAQLRAWAAAGRPAALGGRCTHDQIGRVLGGTSHTDPTPGYPIDLLNVAVTRYRSGAPTPSGDDMADVPQDQWDDVRAAVSRIDNRTAHLDTAGMGALARLDAGLPKVLTALTAAGVDDAKRDAAVLGAIAALPKGADVDVEALAAALAEHGVALDAETIAKAVRADLAVALAGESA